jgi:ABC-2 type transport system permease protein
MSPVHDQSYRRYQGARQPVGGGWAVILRAGIRTLLGRKIFIGLLVFSWLPFLVRTVQIYLVATYPQAGQILPINPRTFQSFIEMQGLFGFFMTIYVGAGLVASDRRARALQLYLSKPIRRVEYIAGKLGVLLAALAASTVLPALLLLVMQVVLSGSFDLLREHPTLVPAVFLVASLRAIVPAFAMLGLSAVSTSARYVAVLYAGIIFFTEAMYNLLAFVTGSTRIAWLSLGANYDIVSDAAFRQPARYETPVIVSVIVLIAVVTIAASVLERQVKGVEVVS